MNLLSDKVDKSFHYEDDSSTFFATTIISIFSQENTVAVVAFNGRQTNS